MPGKFEGAHDEDLAERLHTLSMPGTEESTGSTEWRYHVTLLADVSPTDVAPFPRFGTGLRHFVLFEDDRGFVKYEEFATSARAKAAFERLRDLFEAWAEED